MRIFPKKYPGGFRAKAAPSALCFQYPEQHLNCGFPAKAVNLMREGLQRKSRRNREAILRNWSGKPGFFACVSGQKNAPKI
jgi:hypothetical protein